MVMPTTAPVAPIAPVAPMAPNAFAAPTTAVLLNDGSISYLNLQDLQSAFDMKITYRGRGRNYPENGANIKFNYIGYLPDGTKFDEVSIFKPI